MRTNHTSGPTDDFIEGLRQRFALHPERHTEIAWSDVRTMLIETPEVLNAVYGMEITGGKPDVVVLDSLQQQIILCDCSAESPVQRRSLCYDDPALQARKTNKPAGSAEGMAQRMGIELLTESMYLSLQHLGPFDTKTSSWIQTPPEMRVRGGALFGACRFGRIFFYHNSAESYYAGRGFRGFVRLRG